MKNVSNNFELTFSLGRGTKETGDGNAKEARKNRKVES